jgi:hypothetical protein
MSTEKKKKNLKILRGFLRSRCMYRTTAKFLVHHFSFKKFSSGVLPNTPVVFFLIFSIALYIALRFGSIFQYVGEHYSSISQYINMGEHSTSNYVYIYTVYI